VYAPVSATRYFTGALVAMSRVNVAIPALQRPREPFFDAMPAPLTHDARSRRLPWHVDRKGGGKVLAIALRLRKKAIA